MASAANFEFFAVRFGRFDKHCLPRCCWRARVVDRLDAAGVTAWLTQPLL